MHIDAELETDALQAPAAMSWHDASLPGSLAPVLPARLKTEHASLCVSLGVCHGNQCHLAFIQHNHELPRSPESWVLFTTSVLFAG